MKRLIISIGLALCALVSGFSQEVERTDTLREAYGGSINTILTSGSIIVLCTVILGYAFPNPTIGQICHTIAKGASCALILIIFVLPGALAALDPLLIKKKLPR